MKMAPVRQEKGLLALIPPCVLLKAGVTVIISLFVMPVFFTNFYETLDAVGL